MSICAGLPDSLLEVLRLELARLGKHVVDERFTGIGGGAGGGGGGCGGRRLAMIRCASLGMITVRRWEVDCLGSGRRAKVMYHQAVVRYARVKVLRGVSTVTVWK